MSLIKKLAGETAIYGLSSIIGRFANYLLVPLYTNIFDKAPYGIVSELYAYVGFLMVIFTYRMETGFFRFGTPKADRDKAFSTTSIAILLTTPLFAGLLIGFSQPIADWLQYPDNANYVIWFALVLAFDALAAVPFARLRLDNKPIRFAAIKLTNIGINIGSNLFFLLLCPYLSHKGFSWVDNIYNENLGIGYIFISNLLASIVTILLLAPTYFKIKLQFDKKLMRKILAYSMPLVIVGFASVINELLDRTLLKWLLPGTLDENMAELGVYSACYKLAMLMTLFTQAFNYAAEPFFFSNADRKDAKKTYAQVAQVFTIVGALGFLGITLYIDIFKHFIGSEFRDGLVIVPILLMANLALGLYYNFAIWYKLKDKTNIGALIAIGGALITLVLNIWWIPKIGYVGSAWATLICYASMAAAAYLVGRKYYPVPYPILKIMLYIVLALVVYQVSMVVQSSFAIGAGTLSLYAVNTVLLLAFISIIFRMDLDLFRSIIKGGTS